MCRCLTPTLRATRWGLLLYGWQLWMCPLNVTGQTVGIPTHPFVHGRRKGAVRLEHMLSFKCPSSQGTGSQLSLLICTSATRPTGPFTEPGSRSWPNGGTAINKTRRGTRTMADHIARPPVARHVATMFCSICIPGHIPRLAAQSAQPCV